MNINIQPVSTQINTNKINNQSYSIKSNSYVKLLSNDQVAFKAGKAPNGNSIKNVFKDVCSKIGSAINYVDEKVGSTYAEKYAVPLMNKKWVHDLSAKLSGASDMMTQHMATVGSVLTSGVYMYKTLTKKDLDDEKRTTLAINQAGCCIVPTACAYLVDSKLRNFNKNMEKTYSTYKRKQLASGKLNPKQYQELTESLGKKLKFFGALMGLTTFTFIYRYGTPVVITPIANKCGEKFNNWRAARRQKMQESQDAKLS